MRSLKPLTTFVGGSVLLAVAVVTRAAVVQPDMRNPRGVAICLVTGAVLGMFIFGPIAVVTRSDPHSSAATPSSSSGGRRSCLRWD
jgi:hypothetical protein